MRIIHFITQDQETFIELFKRTIFKNIEAEYFVCAHNSFKEKFHHPTIFFNNVSELSKYNPDIILLTITPGKEYVEHISRELNFPLSKMWYLHHGLIHIHSNTTTHRHWSRDINYVVSCNFGYKFLQSLGMTVHKICGIPQFELLENCVAKPKTVLIVNGSSQQKFYDSTKHIFEISKKIKTVYPDFQILLKNKIDRKMSQQNFGSIKFVDEIYPHLKSEIVIIVEGGTSHVEALMVNKRTILFGKDVFGCSVENLLHTENFVELEELLKMECEQKHIDAYISNVIGGKIKTSAPQFLNLLK